MRHVGRLAMGVLGGSAVLVAAAQVPGGPSFRTGVDVIAVAVTVTDSAGRQVPDLQPSDFTIFENGSPQDIAFFGRSELPIALDLLIDRSASMADKLATAQQAAVGLVKRLRPEDSAQVIDFNTRVQVAQAWTRDPAALERALRAARAGGSTSLYTAIYVALKDLERQRQQNPGDLKREALVVLTDGEDTSSLLTFDELLQLAGQSHTAVYLIGLLSPDENNARANDAKFLMRRLADQTGGRAFFPPDPTKLSAVYDEIGRDLTGQYLVGYTPSDSHHDGRWHWISVRVRRLGTQVRARLGYFAGR
jgi:Ca-activated chloride channel homolog